MGDEVVEFFFMLCGDELKILLVFVGYLFDKLCIELFFFEEVFFEFYWIVLWSVV